MSSSKDDLKTDSFTDGNQKKDDNSIVIVAGEVTKHVENTSFLLAVLLLGNLFFIAIIVLFILQAYESYKKKRLYSSRLLN